MKLKHLNYRQIRALIKKDILVRLRQPVSSCKIIYFFSFSHFFIVVCHISFFSFQWMTFLSIFWPCAIFMSLYILRLRFQPHQIDNCQFPTRQLPSTNDLLPFFQSYICTIESKFDLSFARLEFQ